MERLADQLDAEALGDLDALRRAAARSRQLVQTLLEHARARRRPLERHPVDVNAVVGETLILLGPEIRARGAVMDVGELPWVMGDGTLITAVFTNLLTNALKFGPRVGTDIRVVAREDPEGWRFYIKSEGRGDRARGPRAHLRALSARPRRAAHARDRPGPRHLPRDRLVARGQHGRAGDRRKAQRLLVHPAGA